MAHIFCIFPALSFKLKLFFDQSFPITFTQEKCIAVGKSIRALGV